MFSFRSTVVFLSTMLFMAGRHYRSTDFVGIIDIYNKDESRQMTVLMNNFTYTEPLTMNNSSRLNVTIFTESSISVRNQTIKVPRSVKNVEDSTSLRNTTKLTAHLKRWYSPQNHTFPEREHESLKNGSGQVAASHSAPPSDERITANETSHNTIAPTRSKNESRGDSSKEPTKHAARKTACHNATFLQELIAYRKEQMKKFSPHRPLNQTHWPTFFKDQVNVSLLAARQNFIHPRSGCRLTRWVLPSPSKIRACIDCADRATHEQQRITTMSNIEKHDTIYVPFAALAQFVLETLPKLKVQVILISGQWQTVPSPSWNVTWTKLIESPYILHMFVMHKPIYAPYPSAKISSWPLGLNYRFVHHFQNEFSIPAAKTELVFYSKLGDTAEFRKDLPSDGPKLKPPAYYSRLHQAHHILAPSGRRPDSFRMYEALGLGAKPITNLEPDSFEHFYGEQDSFIFGVDRWTKEDITCYVEAAGQAKPNQRFVFDEYWMEHVDRVVGVPLRWWDNKGNRVALLTDIASTL